MHAKYLLKALKLIFVTLEFHFGGILHTINFKVQKKMRKHEYLFTVCFHRYILFPLKWPTYLH